MKIEKEVIFKKQLNTLLNKIATFALTFVKKVEEHGEPDEINKFIISHPIYEKREKIKTFANIIINANESFNNKIIEIQENSEIKQKRKKELNKINSFLSSNNQKILLEQDMNDKKLLPPPEPEANIIQDKGEINIEKNILEEKEEENDILIEDEKNTINKKNFWEKK